MTAHRHNKSGAKHLSATGEEIAFLVLGGAYSLAFWALQGWRIWHSLQRLL